MRQRSQPLELVLAEFLKAPIMGPMMMRFLTVLPFVFLGFSGALAQETEHLYGFDFEAVPDTTWQLPKELKDISGLAMTPDSRLFASEYERAIIHEIDYVNGAIIKTFSFGRPAAKKNFTALAIAGKRFFVINPKGLMLEGREGFNYEGKVFNSHDTGFGVKCEVMGLAATDAKVLALCGKIKDKAYEGKLTILSWDIATKRADEAPYFQMNWGGEGFPEDLSSFAPAGLEVMPSGNFLVLSADKKRLVEISPDGGILDFKTLNKKVHDNPVGVTVTQDGEIIIADEGGSPSILVFKKAL
jgi:hypothetical protein